MKQEIKFYESNRLIDGQYTRDRDRLRFKFKYASMIFQILYGQTRAGIHRKKTKQTDTYTDNKLLFNLSKLGQEEFISFINETPGTTFNIQKKISE